MTATARAKARSGRNVLLWCAAIVGISIVLAVLAPRNTDSYLDPAGHGPNGVAALVEVLRDHGVQVELVDTVAGLSAALTGSAGPAQTTVAIGDSRLLTARGAEAVTRAINGAGRLVLLDGAPAVLDVVDPEVQVFAAGGGGSDEFAAECSDLRALDRGAESGLRRHHRDRGGAGPDPGVRFRDGRGELRAGRVTVPKRLPALGVSAGRRSPVPGADPATRQLGQ